MLDIFADAIEQDVVTDELIDHVFPQDGDDYDTLIAAIGDAIESLAQQKPYYQWTAEELLDSPLYHQLSLRPEHRRMTLLDVLQHHIDDILAIEDYIYHEYRRLTVFALMRLWLGRQWGMPDRDGIRLLLQWRRDDTDIGYPTLSWGDTTMLLPFVTSADVEASVYPAARGVIRACISWHSNLEPYQDMYTQFDGEVAELLTIRAEGSVIYDWAQTYGHEALLDYAIGVHQKKPSAAQKEVLLTYQSPTEDEWSDLLLTLAEQPTNGPSLAPPIEQTMRVLLLRIQQPSATLAEDLLYYVNHCLSVCQYGILSPALAFAAIDVIGRSPDAGPYLAQAVHVSHKTASKRALGVLERWARQADVNVAELVEIYGFGRTLVNESVILNFESAQATLAVALDGTVTVTTSSANAHGKGIPRWFSQEHPEDAKVVRATVKQLKATVEQFVVWCSNLWLHDTAISPQSFARRMEHDLTHRLAEGIWWIATTGERWQGPVMPDLTDDAGIRPWHPLDGNPPAHDEGVLAQVNAPVNVYVAQEWRKNRLQQWRGAAVQRTTLARAFTQRGWTFSESWPSSWAGEPEFVLGPVTLSMTGEEAVMWGQPVTVHDVIVNDRQHLSSLTAIQYSALIDSIDAAITKALKNP